MDRKIMIIDDDRSTLKVVKSSLESKGYSVVTAEDGEEGLQKLQNEKPDAIVLDVEMPQMNGYTFVRELKKIKGLQSLPVVILTSHEEMKPIFDLNEVAGFIKKPFQINELFDKIEHCWGNGNS